MQIFWEIVASNALLVVILAAGVALLGRFWKNPLCLHLLWVFVLLKLVTPPAVTVPICLPESQTPPASAEFAVHELAANPLPIVSHRAKMESRNHIHDHQSSPPDRPVAVVPAPELGMDVAPSVTQSYEMSWQSVLGWIWGIGIGLFTARHFFRILRFRRLLHSGESPSSAIVAMAEGIAKRLGLRRVPTIQMLPVCVSPLVWSLGARPQVFLPAALFQRLDETAREAILAHELAHVRRNDHWVRLLEMLITTLFWWHPVVWWAARQLQELEDQCCDSVAVDLIPHGVKSYATALLDTLDFLSERSVAAPLGATAAKSSNSLARRIAMLKNRSWNVRLTFSRLMLLLVVAAFPMVLAFGQKQPEAANTEKTADKTPAVKESPLPERKQPKAADGKPQVEVDLVLVQVPRKLDLVKKLPGGGVILSEAETKKLLEDNKDDALLAPRLVCPLGEWCFIKANFSVESIALCQVVPEAIRENGAIALRIKPVVSVSGTMKDGSEKSVTLPRPKDWPTSVNAELKPNEAVVLGGWDEAGNARDSVAVFVIQAARYAGPSADSPSGSGSRSSASFRSLKSMSIPKELMKPVVGKNFVMVPFTSECQRMSGWNYGDAKVFVLINGKALFKEKDTVLDASAFDYEELNKALEPFEARPGSTEGFIACVVGPETPSPTYPTTMSASSAFFSFLDRQGWDCSFGHGNVEYCHYTRDIDWPAVVAALSKPATEEENRLEAGVGDDLVKVYPICTPLSRYLNKSLSENCVLRNMKPLDQLTPEEIKAFPERAKAYIAKLELKEPPHIRFLVEHGNLCSRSVRAKRLTHIEDDAWWKEQGCKSCSFTMLDHGGYRDPILLVKIVDDSKGNLVQDAKISIAFPEENKEDMPGWCRKPTEFTKRSDGLWLSSQIRNNEDFTLTIQSPGYKTHSQKLNLPIDVTKEIEVRLEKE